MHSFFCSPDWRFNCSYSETCSPLHCADLCGYAEVHEAFVEQLCDTKHHLSSLSSQNQLLLKWSTLLIIKLTTPFSCWLPLQWRVISWMYLFHRQCWQSWHEIPGYCWRQAISSVWTPQGPWIAPINIMFGYDVVKYHSAELSLSLSQLTRMTSLLTKTICTELCFLVLLLYFSNYHNREMDKYCLSPNRMSFWYLACFVLSDLLSLSPPPQLYHWIQRSHPCPLVSTNTPNFLCGCGICSSPSFIFLQQYIAICFINNGYNIEDQSLWQELLNVSLGLNPWSSFQLAILCALIQIHWKIKCYFSPSSFACSNNHFCFPPSFSSNFLPATITVPSTWLHNKNFLWPHYMHQIPLA